MNSRLIDIRDLTVEARSDSGWSKIISGISMHVNKGEVLGLIGESGAGKSTVGLAAMGFTHDGCRISDGSVRFDGQELVGAPKQQLREIRGKRIAYVAQSAAASFNPAYRLIDQHCEAPVRHRIMSREDARRDAIGIYRSLYLPNPETIGLRYPHQVSGGQLQRAMTAMAMSCRPDLLIFDEPTTALDVTTQVKVLAAIRKVVEQFQTAAIYISHDLAVVAQMADRIKILLKGEEVEEASTTKMLANPQHEYTKSLWAVRTYQRTEKSKNTMTEKPMLSVRSVTAAYGKKPVLQDVSLDICQGQTVAIVGESGSGKSTIARVVTGLMTPINGEVLLYGKPLPPSFKARSKDELRSIQLVFQSSDTALNPKIRVGEIIGYPLRFYGGLKGRALRERVREILAAMELEPDEYIDRLPGELSGGQKQRIGIARALAAEPKLIICDEVTSALDQIVAESILRLLDRLQSEFDLGYMFITHDLESVRAIADAVVVMHGGQVVDAGARTTVFSPPHKPYTEKLLSMVPQMDPDWLTNLLKEKQEDILKQSD